MNLIDHQMTREYLAALELAENDNEVRIIVLSGAGRGLSGGVNLKILESYSAADMKEIRKSIVAKAQGLMPSIRPAAAILNREKVRNFLITES